jgi:hypothetical protein
MNIDKKVNHVHNILPFRFSFIYLLGILVSGSIKIWAFLGVKFQFIAHNKTWSDIRDSKYVGPEKQPRDP